MAKENICGKAFEELSSDELNEYSGGAVTVTTTVVSTSLPCTVSAGIASLVSVIYYTIKN